MKYKVYLVAIVYCTAVTLCIVYFKTGQEPRSQNLFSEQYINNNDHYECLPLQRGQKIPVQFNISTLPNLDGDKVLSIPYVQHVGRYVAQQEPYIRPEVYYTVHTQQMACKYREILTLFEFICDPTIDRKQSNDKYTNYLIQDHNSVIDLITVPCGYVDCGSKNLDLTGAVLTEYGYLSEPSYFRFKGEEVFIDLDELATVGPSLLAHFFGHWPNEVLPKLLFMWDKTPVNVPILWPKNIENVLNELYDLKILKQGRPVIFQHHKSKVIYRAKKLYTLHNLRDQPVYWRLINPVVWLHTQQLYRKVFQSEQPKNTILVINRNIMFKNPTYQVYRGMNNFNELISALKEKYEPQYQIEIYTPQETYFDGGRMFYHAKIVVGVHGAGMSHVIFQRAGTSVLEIGVIDPKVMLPNMYYAQATALGLHYSSVLVEGGFYNVNVTVPINEIVDVVQYNLSK
jgi:hypothetical protein